MPLLEVLRAINEASRYWTGEPMDVKAAVAVVGMGEESDEA